MTAMFMSADALSAKDRKEIMNSMYVVGSRIGSEKDIVAEELDEYHVTAIKAGEPELGQLTLIVTQDPIALKQWELVDMKGIKSTVGLYEIEENIPVDNALFVFQKAD